MAQPTVSARSTRFQQSGGTIGFDKLHRDDFESNSK